MSDITFVSNVTVIPADWANDINDFYYTIFGATGGLACIGDNANANMTIGLTIKQGTADNEIIAWKADEVAHGVTSETETDTFGCGKKYAAATGGFALWGFSEDVVGMFMAGVVTTGTTTKTSGGYGALRLSGLLKSGTAAGALGADDNVLSVDSNGVTKFIVSNSGYAYALGGLAITDGVTAPSAVTGYAVIYVDTADGDLKVKFADGTTKVIVADT